MRYKMIKVHQIIDLGDLKINPMEGVFFKDKLIINHKEMTEILIDLIFEKMKLVTLNQKAE